MYIDTVKERRIFVLWGNSEIDNVIKMWWYKTLIVKYDVVQIFGKNLQSFLRNGSLRWLLEEDSWPEIEKSINGGSLSLRLK